MRLGQIRAMHHVENKNERVKTLDETIVGKQQSKFKNKGERTHLTPLWIPTVLRHLADKHVDGGPNIVFAVRSRNGWNCNEQARTSGRSIYASRLGCFGRVGEGCRALERGSGGSRVGESSWENGRRLTENGSSCLAMARSGWSRAEHEIEYLCERDEGCNQRVRRAFALGSSF